VTLLADLEEFVADHRAHDPPPGAPMAAWRNDGVRMTRSCGALLVRVVTFG